MSPTQASQASHTADLKECQDLKLAITTLTHRITSVHYSEQDESALRAECHRCVSQLQCMKDTADALSGELEGKLAFHFKDPERAFDRSRVKGVSSGCEQCVLV